MANEMGVLVNPDQSLPMPGPVPRTPEEHAALTKSWLDYFQHPDVQTALLQFGASVMQPPGAGQSTIGQVGTAMGEAGGAVGRYQAGQREAAQLETANQLKNREAGQTDTELAQRNATEQERNRIASQIATQEGAYQTGVLGTEQERNRIALLEANKAGAATADPAEALRRELILAGYKAAVDTAIANGTAPPDPNEWAAKYAAPGSNPLPTAGTPIASPTAPPPWPQVTSDMARSLKYANDPKSQAIYQQARTYYLNPVNNPDHLAHDLDTLAGAPPGSVVQTQVPTAPIGRGPGVPNLPPQPTEPQKPHAGR